MKSEKRILSREEMEILLENSKGGMMYPIFVVALGTGMRIGEILGLTWDCIDFDNRIITVKQTLTYLPGDGQIAQYEFHQPKTNAGFRKIPMIKKVHDVLIYQRIYHKDIATRFSPREGFEDLVFTSKTTENIKDSINYIVDRINRENPERSVDLTLQTKERRALPMYVTYSDLIQIGVFICALVGLCYTIFKGKRK